MAILTIDAIREIERSLGVKLPGLYRNLLTQIGFGPVGRDALIYDPTEVRALYAPFFDDPSSLFHPYFPIGCQNRKQELWIINAAIERAASIWHETVPEDWPQEEWLEYDQWVMKVLESETRSD